MLVQFGASKLSDNIARKVNTENILGFENIFNTDSSEEKG